MKDVSVTRFNVILAAFASFICVPGPALATEAAGYPARPIRMVLPQAPGSATDSIARVIAAELTRQMGQQVVIDNRPGGALMIGMELTARAPPDGYTLGYAPIGSLAIGPHIAATLPFDVRKDLEPISQTARGQMLLAAGKTLRRHARLARAIFSQAPDLRPPHSGMRPAYTA